MTGPRPDPEEHLECEVLVVGAGPAGSTVAALLASEGTDVLLVDRGRFPRSKACGECLNPGGVAVLGRLGLLGPVLDTDPVQLRGWTFSTPEGTRAHADFPNRQHALGVDRRRLDHSLLRHARARGATVLEGVRIEGAEPGGPLGMPSAWGRRSGGRKLHIGCRTLVGADGLRSVVARSLGAVKTPPGIRKASLTWRVRGAGPSRTRGHLLLGGALTTGLAPVPGDRLADDIPRWNASLVVDPGRWGNELKADPWALLLKGMELMEPGWRTHPEREDGPWASGPFDWPARTAAVGRTLLVGDAAGYYDPLTGQGLFRALRSAELAAEAVRRTRDCGTRGNPHRAYARRLRREFRTGRAIQRAIERILRHSPPRNAALRTLAASPRMASWLLSVTGDLQAARSRQPGAAEPVRSGGVEEPD